MADMVSFFEIVADSSLFAGAFDKAKAKSIEFAAVFKASTASVVADSAKMQIAAKAAAASSLTPGAGPEAAAFYGHGVGTAATGATAAENDAATATRGMGSAGSLAMVGLQAAAYGLLAITAAAIGVLAITERMVVSQAAFSTAVLQDSEAIGMNAQELQVWQRIATLVGVDQQSLTLDFERFAKNLEEGAKALKPAGVTLQELGITTTNVGTAVLQLSDYFHTHTDQAQKAAIATALFGRSGAELIPILDQGSAAVQRYAAQLQAAGVILSNTQLFQGAQAQAAITEMSDAFNVAKSELVGAALPGFTVFFQTLSIVMKNNASLWVQVGQTIGDVVMFISGLVAGLAGVNIKDVLAAPTQAGAAYQGLGQNAAGAAPGIDAATAAANRATAAIDAQIQTLNDQTRAYNDAADAQKQALQSQLDTLNDVNDTRRRQGEDIVDYERRLEALGLQDKITAIDNAKSTYDRQAADHLAALEKERAAVKTASGQMATDLTGGMNTGMVGLNQSLAAGMSKAQLALLAKAHEIGKDIAGIFNPNNAQALASAQNLGRLLGGALGDGIKAGLLNWVGRQIITSAEAGGPAVWGAQILTAVFGGMMDQLTGHATGYVGSTEHIARISEGNQPEAVLPLNNPSRSLAIMRQTGLASLAQGGGGGGGQGVPAVNIYFTGPVADELVANRVLSKITSEMRKLGFNLSRGI